MQQKLIDMNTDNKKDNKIEKTKAPSISLCMIAKNEEEWLSQCLNSVKEIVSEIIFVDTGSTDKTKEIAKSYGARVFDYKWKDDFADARNFSISKATKNWILWLDADETISAKDFDYIRKFVTEAQFPIIVLEQRHYTNDTSHPRFKPIDERYRDEAKGFKGYYPTLMMRLFKNGLGLKFDGVIHETLDKSMRELGLKFLRTDIPVHHYQNLKKQGFLTEKKDKYMHLLEEKEKIDPADIKNIHDIAIMHLQKQDFKTAFSYFRKVYDMDKDLLEPYFGMGLIWAKRGNYQRAIKFFLTALSKKTAQSIELSIPIEQVRETILYNLAICFLKVGKRKQAIQIFTDMIRLNSRFTQQIQEKLKQLGIHGRSSAG